MKISRIAIAIITVSIFTLSACKETKSKSETTEEQAVEKVVNQEEFNINGASAETPATDEQSNTATIIIKANKALEYKFKMNQYEKLEYEWTADAPLRYDFHGDPEDKASYPKGYFESYANGTSNTVKGKATIPYEGAHGWYWKNTSAKDITITLTTKGNYNIIGIIE
jgi:hypothetical protein